jgi:hypothetical protein
LTKPHQRLSKNAAQVAAIGLGLSLAVQAIAGHPSEAKAEERHEILQSLDRYWEVATRCHFAGQEYDVDFVFDALLDIDKISHAVEAATSRLAWQIDPQSRVQVIGEGVEISPKFTSCFLQGKKARTGKSPMGGKQSPDLPTIVIAVLATNMDVDDRSNLAGRVEIQSAVEDGWPIVWLDENGDWHGRGGFQDYISMVPTVGPARLIQCRNKQPTLEKVPSKFLVESVIIRCEKTAEFHTATLMVFGLGNFVGWGDFDQTHKLWIEDAGYLALQFEVFRGLSKIIGESNDGAQTPDQKADAAVEIDGPEIARLPASVADHTFKSYYAWRYYAPNGTFEHSDGYGTIKTGRWWMKDGEVCAQFDFAGAKPLCSKPDFSRLTPGRSPG